MIHIDYKKVIEETRRRLKFGKGYRGRIKLLEDDVAFLLHHLSLYREQQSGINAAFDYRLRKNEEAGGKEGATTKH